MRGSWIAEGSLVVFSVPLLAKDTARGALTQAESEVACMAARGLTNAQIAARRRVSPRTVSKQLESVYRKLSVETRTELAIALASATDTR